MTISTELILNGSAFLVAGGIAWGISKATLHNKVGYREHSEICGKVMDSESNKRADVYKKIDENHQKIMDVLMEIKEDIGMLKGN